MGLRHVDHGVELAELETVGKDLICIVGLRRFFLLLYQPTILEQGWKRPNLYCGIETGFLEVARCRWGLACWKRPNLYCGIETSAAFLRRTKFRRRLSWKRPNLYCGIETWRERGLLLAGANTERWKRPNLYCGIETSSSSAQSTAFSPSSVGKDLICIVGLRLISEADIDGILAGGWKRPNLYCGIETGLLVFRSTKHQRTFRWKRPNLYCGIET